MTTPASPATPTSATSCTGALQAPAPGRDGVVPLALLVFVVGSASLGSEIAAARLLAPWFGASTIVWANTIAIVLVALSIGYAVGGRVADKHPHRAGLSRIVLLAAFLLALVPFVSEPFLPLAVSAVDGLSVGTFLGSLVGVGVLIAVPLLLLGMVSPYAVRLCVHHVEDAGRMAGRLYAISTVGSLVGTFLASLLLIPVLGTRRTFIVFALAMALAALPDVGRGRRLLIVVPVVIVALGLLPTGVVKQAGAAGRVVWEKETEYQYARVVQSDTGTRYLELNEGHAVHSTFTQGQYLTGNYWDEMLAATLAGEQSPPRSVAILGNAAGTTARALGRYSPSTRVDAVEIDPALTEVGRDLFGLEGPNLHTYAADARPWLKSTDRRYDAILVDAYRQPYIPFYLSTREFFDLTRDRLAPGGVVAINVGQPPGSRALEKVLTSTLESAFGPGSVTRTVATSTNTVLIASAPGGDPAARMSEHADQVPSDLAQVLRQAAADTGPAMKGGRVYTDDVAPVEWLVDTSLAQVAEQ